MRIWFIALCIFVFALSLRLWNLHDGGRWSDEQAFLEKGYRLNELIKQKDFSHPYWYTDGADHPPVAYYLYGLASYKDFIKFDTTAVSSNSKLFTGAPVFAYDMPNSRMLSILLSSLTVMLVFFIGLRYVSLFTGIASSIMLALLPHFLGYSQFVDLENLILFFFTAAAFSFIRFLETKKDKFLILTGILTGISVGIKESNVLLFPFYFGSFFIWKTINKKPIPSFAHLFFIGFIACITFIALWPMPFFHLHEYSNFVYNLWIKNNGLVPELLFGKTMGARFFYYPVAFFVTTPVLIILLTGIGITISIMQRKQWFYPILIWWFIVPFFMMFFHHRQHMMRYIIEVYIPLSLLAGIGLEFCARRIIKNSIIVYCAIIPISIYLFFILLNMTPYYLSYYNELVGGTKQVYEKKLFYLGWFGEGLKGPGEYVAKHAAKNARIGLALNLDSGFYKIPTIHYETFNSNHSYDFVIVSYFNVVRLGFDEKILEKEYTLVYREKADGADLARVYKHK